MVDSIILVSDSEGVESVSPFSHFGFGTSKTNKDGHGAFVVSVLEVVEVVGSGDDLRCSSDDFELGMVVSAFSVDFSDASGDEVSIVLGDIGSSWSAHHFLCNKKICYLITALDLSDL